MKLKYFVNYYTTSWNTLSEEYESKHYEDIITLSNVGSVKDIYDAIKAVRGVNVSGISFMVVVP